MKTAMQELITEMKYLETYPMTSFVIKLATRLLEKEKEQIENAYWASYKEGQYSGDKTAEEYYNETYFQNK